MVEQRLGSHVLVFADNDEVSVLFAKREARMAYRERGLVHLDRFRILLAQPAVSRDAVTRADLHDVARHEAVGFETLRQA